MLFSIESMLRVTILTITLTVVLADGDMKKCGRLFHPITMSCCKDMPGPDTDKDDLKECFKAPRDHHSCDLDICIAKKRGIASDDGAVDMDAWEKMVTEDFKSHPSLVTAIKHNCIKGDVSQNGPPDACQLKKLNSCVHRAMVLNCKEWSDEGPCAGLNDLVKECAKMEE